MLELPPLSLYIHVPWCVRKCPYCDFNSHEAVDAIPEDAYVAALCNDFDQDIDYCQDREIQSIFIGGGTPSLFSAAAYQTVFNHVQKNSRLARNCEITLEANPGTAEAKKFSDFRSVGINRLSIGVQSFDDEQLKKLGRVHDSAQARRAIAMAMDAGFDNFNLDLMYGLPEQKPAQAVADLNEACSFNPSHLSWYQLTIEANTVFHSAPPPIPVESAIIEMQDSGQALLTNAGYQQYEVSAYSKPDKASQHNLNYWQFGDYLGIGAGAHGKISRVDTGNIVRTRKIKQPKHYLANSIKPTAQRLEIQHEELALEFLLNALRLRQGFSISMFECRTGVPFSSIGKRVEYLIDRGLLVNHENVIKPTDKGYELLNSVLEEFL